jgi:hypothetical protein
MRPMRDRVATALGVLFALGLLSLALYVLYLSLFVSHSPFF